MFYSWKLPKVKDMCVFSTFRILVNINVHGISIPKACEFLLDFHLSHSSAQQEFHRFD